MAAPRGSEVWRDYVTDGIPSSGNNNPKKSDARAWSSWLESLVTSGVLSSGPWFTTKAAMTLGYVANTIAVVYNDPTAANNGLYIKSGASGAGSWAQLTSFLPGYQFVTASPTGESTANAIVALTSPRLPSGDGVALVTLAIPATNTATPVTVRFDGGAVLTIKTRTGEDPDAGELQQNDLVAGFVSGANFRLISDLNSLRNYQSAKAWANTDEDTPIPAILGGDGATTFSAKHWAAKSEEDADRSDDEADRSEVARVGAESARDQAAGYVNDIVSEKEVPITATRNGMEALQFPAGMNSLETRGYAAIGDGGGAQYVRVASEPAHGLKVRSLDRFLPNGVIDEVSGGWWEIAEDAVTVLMGGARGDCAGVGIGADDSSAIQRTLSWLVTHPTGTVTFPGGFRYRMSSGVSITFGGGDAGRIIMHGPITPDPGIGNAITIFNGLGGEFELLVNQGGQDADYTQADPVGCDQAFVVRGFRGARLSVGGRGYKGRVLRIPKALPGERKNSFYTIKRIYTGYLIADLDDVCGQAAFIDTHDNAFGQIVSFNPVWDKYGPVFADTHDLTITHMEGSWRMSSSGLEFRGCLSVWLGSVALGDETQTVDLITFKNSAVNACNNILWDQLFLVGASRGLVMENAGQLNPAGTSSSGAIINGVHTRSCLVGIDLVNSRDIEINQQSYLDTISYRETGATSQRNRVKCRSIGAGKTGMEIGAGAGLNGVYEPTIFSSNPTSGPDAPAFKIASAQPMIIRDPFIQNPNATSGFDLLANNNVRIHGGRIIQFPAFTNRPLMAKDVGDYPTESENVATMPTGAADLVVAHGLREIPEVVFLQPGHIETRDAIVDTRTSTTFTIHLPAATTGARNIFWRAATPSGIGKATS
ncbi:UNVERIFIED_ORG: hypothetical protein J2740_002489 [Rhizobium nepotum]|nr:hypothetical protein [Rhizobium nepotum]